MSALLTFANASKRHGAQPIFSDLGLTISEGERLGIIGPNGAGKSTLLRVIAGEEELDGGECIRRRDIAVAYVSQTAEFDEQRTPLELALSASAAAAHSHAEQERLARTALGSLEVEGLERPCATLSGGQRKRLQIALALARDPQLLLLDEPTNHLDIESIMLLESILGRARFAWVMVTHDRWFLENTARRIAEVNARFPGNIFTVEGSYGEFVPRREAFEAAQQRQLESLANKARVEQGWLRQGAKARSTKSKHRIDRAYALMDSLALIRARTRHANAELEFDSSERKTKKLIQLKGVAKRYPGAEILRGVDLTLTAGQALGILGRNGSGKTTLLKIITGEIEPDGGTVQRALDLRVSYFRQIDTTVAPDLRLKEVIAPAGDSVVFRGSLLHAASWAKRFGFRFEQLEQPYRSLSGGEQARARIARLMLETPDVLVLDEPTNDLDIETLETLESSLVAFEGALVLVTHDRFMLNRVCTRFLGLHTDGSVTPYADFAQWEASLGAADAKEPKEAKPQPSGAPRQKPQAKLSYKEQRELDSMEAAITTAEAEVARLQETLAGGAATTNPEQLAELCRSLDQAEQQVQTLYRRWEELEEKVAK